MDHVGAGTFAKPLLVELSHTVERIALATDPGTPTVVIAMFQRMAYFRREAAVYGEIAARGAVTVVGLVDDEPHQLPSGVRHVRLDPDDDLVREWSVTVLTPWAGATLVAADLETLEPAAATVEQGRTFRAGWSFRREEARRQVVRLREKLRIDAAGAAAVDAVLRSVAATPEPVGQAPWDDALRFLAGRVDEALREKAANAAALAQAVETTERDRHTGFYTEAFLHRWLAGAVAGTVPMGLALLQLPGLAAVRARYGRRAELAVLRRVADGVRRVTRDGDRVVTVGPEDFLVVLPSAGPEDVRRVCTEMSSIAARLDEAYPFVALPAVVAGTVTRDRPLPIDRLRQQAAPDHRGLLVPS